MLRKHNSDYIPGFRKIDFWNEPSEVDLNFIQEYLLAGKYYLDGGAPERAYRMFKKILSCNQINTQARIEALYGRGIACLGLGSNFFKEAKAAFDGIGLVVENPLHALRMTGLGWLYLHQGERTKAIRFFTSVLRMYGDYPLAAEGLRKAIS